MDNGRFAQRPEIQYAVNGCFFVVEARSVSEKLQRQVGLLFGERK